MEAPTIAAEERDRVGTRYARRLRSSGRLPGVIYGHKETPVAVSLDEHDMLNFLHHGQRLFTIEINGKPETCLVKDLQFDHLGTDVIHIDFARVNLQEEVEVSIPIHFLGEAAGLKVPGAILRTVLDYIILRCQVRNIPTEVPLDISGLEAGEYLSAGDIELPEGAALVTDENELIVRIAVVEEIEEPEEAEEAVEGEPEIIGEAEGDEGEESAEAEGEAKEE